MTDPSSAPAPQRYPNLARFMGGWFHQDFDLIAPSWQGVVDAYRAASSHAERAALRVEIADFMAECDDDPATIESRFRMDFAPEVLTENLAGTTQAFLQAIHAHIGER